MLESIAQQIQQVSEVANTPGVKESLDKPGPLTIPLATIALAVAAYGWYHIIRDEWGNKIIDYFKKKKGNRSNRFSSV